MKKSLRSMKQGLDPALAEQLAGPGGERAMADIEQVVAQYQGRSENELMGELQRMVGAERAAGNLDDARLREITGMMAPMLSPEQRRRMEQILTRL